MLHSSLGYDKCTMPCIHYYDIIQNSFPTKNPLYFPHLSLIFTQTFNNHWSFCCFHSFVFSRNHTVGFILSVTFSHWLLLHNNSFNISPCLLEDVISFYHWIIFYCINLQEFINHSPIEEGHFITSSFW